MDALVIVSARAQLLLEREKENSPFLTVFRTFLVALSSHRGLAKGTRAPMGVASDDSSPTTLASTITSPSASTATAPGAASSMALSTAVASLLRFSFFSFLTPLASTLFLFSFLSFFSLLSLAILCVYMCGWWRGWFELELVAGVGITFFSFAFFRSPHKSRALQPFTIAWQRVLCQATEIARLSRVPSNCCNPAL